MSQNLFALLALAGSVASFFSYKQWQLRKIRQENDRLLAENQQQASQIHTQKEVIKNAQVQQKHQQATHRANAGDIDRQLHEKGYFRD